MKPNESFVITISRQMGSGASYIGQQIAKKLGVLYADREIIRKAAERLAVLVEDLESRDEALPSSFLSFLQTNAFTPDVYLPPKLSLPSDRELFDAESEVIDRIARQSSAVIIGRCGFHVLRSHPNHISVFLHADPAFRASRYQKLYQATPAEAQKAIIQCDKDRATHCKTFTSRDWTDARNFDLTIDTSKLPSLDKATDLILQYFEAR